MIDYTEIADLQSIYLEDSWVLGVEATPGAVRFSVEFALTPEHPDYTAPLPNEVHCMRRGMLEFGGVTSLTWGAQQQLAGEDASGEKDYGNIDSMQWESQHYVLSGSWGEMDLFATNAAVTF